MNDTNLILAQNKNFTFVGVRFLDGNNPTSYYYKTFQKFEVGDQAVVDSPISGLTVVEVTQVDCMLDVCNHDNGNYKWIVQKVDMTDYERCRDLEKEVTKHVLGMRFNKVRKEAEEMLTEQLGQDDYMKLVQLVNPDEVLNPESQTEGSYDTAE